MRTNRTDSPVTVRVCIKNSTMNTKNEDVMMGNKCFIMCHTERLPYCWGLLTVLTLTPMICMEQKSLSWFDPLPALFSPSSHTWCQSYETQSQSLSVAAERRRTGSRKRLVSFPDPTQQRLWMTDSYTNWENMALLFIPRSGHPVAFCTWRGAQRAQIWNRHSHCPEGLYQEQRAKRKKSRCTYKGTLTLVPNLKD